jgi:predicted kinase
MEMVIFIGGQGAGKTTFYQSRFFKTHVRINLDMLKTRHREKLLIEACLQMKQPMVIDNTNPTKADRARYIEQALANRFTVMGYYFDAKMEELLTRNAQRSGKERIPEIAIRGTFKKMEKPGRNEGFAGLYRVSTQSDGAFQVEKDSDEV